ncbi:uncharacterized protein LOC109823445 [Asparagus officinalis]|uniref:uncharacterized protein LOC109823445 n=1 Tax=Asparagus officinalis TaxID=4686 RepID=UPI00098E0FC3|nr:uncharacterized protein LOC109823445 [Asparagus officinalis]
MAKDNSKRVNRGFKSSQLVSEQIMLESEAGVDDTMADSEISSQITSQFQNLVQELKQSKEQGQEVPRSRARDERRMSGLEPRNDTGLLGPGIRGMSRQAWLEQTEQIFEYYDIKSDEWVKVCSFYLREEALQWYRWLARNLEEFCQWKIFKEEIITRFGPSELSRPYDAFSTLKQTTTVRDYLGRFEQTLSLLDDQPSRRHILEKFIGGLKEELRYEVTASKPSSLKGAISLAKLFEDKLNNEKKSRVNWNTSNTGVVPTSSSPYPSVRENPKPPSQFKGLTPEEIQRRRSQNLCLTCDEKCPRGHQCKGKQMFLLEGILKGDSEENEVDDGEEGEEDITIEVVGYYKNQAVSILIDSGSTHNFINSKLVKKLGLLVTESNSFDVLVAIGELIKGGGVCNEVSLECQGVKIQVDLLVMPMGGSQIILGADWMKTLEDITLKFKKLQELPHLPPSRSIDQKIQLEDGTKPICIRPYRHAHFLKDEIEKQVEEMLKKGIIRPSNSPFSSPIVMVKKSDGSWRMCVDYRSLNQSTIKDKFPIPVIDELLDELHGTKYFTKLDLKSGYHQITMYEVDIPKTAFRTHSGHYEFLVMPFGLTNAPSTFQALMNTIFKDLLKKFILVFFDDILVYSKGCFGQTQVDYLGHVVSQEGVGVDPKKIEAIVDWPRPKTLKGLRGFLDLAGYYRKFIKNFGVIAQPLIVVEERSLYLGGKC